MSHTHLKIDSGFLINFPRVHQIIDNKLIKRNKKSKNLRQEHSSSIEALWCEGKSGRLPSKVLPRSRVYFVCSKFISCSVQKHESKLWCCFGSRFGFTNHESFSLFGKLMINTKMMKPTSVGKAIVMTSCKVMQQEAIVDILRFPTKEHRKVDKHAKSMMVLNNGIPVKHFHANILPKNLRIFCDYCVKFIKSLLDCMWMLHESRYDVWILPRPRPSLYGVHQKVMQSIKWSALVTVQSSFCHSDK